MTSYLALLLLRRIMAANEVFINPLTPPFMINITEQTQDGYDFQKRIHNDITHVYCRNRHNRTQSHEIKTIKPFGPYHLLQIELILQDDTVCNSILMQEDDMKELRAYVTDQQGNDLQTEGGPIWRDDRTSAHPNPEPYDLDYSDEEEDDEGDPGAWWRVDPDQWWADEQRGREPGRVYAQRPRGVHRRDDNEEFVRRGRRRLDNPMYNPYHLTFNRNIVATYPS